MNEALSLPPRPATDASRRRRRRAPAFPLFAPLLSSSLKQPRSLRRQTDRPTDRPATGHGRGGRWLLSLRLSKSVIVVVVDKRLIASSCFLSLWRLR